MIGTYASVAMGVPAFDGVASIGIGLVLCATVMFLAYETTGLLIGERAHPEIAQSIHGIAQQAAMCDSVPTDQSRQRIVAQSRQFPVWRSAVQLPATPLSARVAGMMAERQSTGRGHIAVIRARKQGVKP
jgi:hypothetical protein